MLLVIHAGHAGLEDHGVSVIRKFFPLLLEEPGAELIRDTNEDQVVVPIEGKVECALLDNRRVRKDFTEMCAGLWIDLDAGKVFDSTSHGGDSACPDSAPDF